MASMKNLLIFTVLVLGACGAPREARQIEKKKPQRTVQAPPTAIDEIRGFHAALEANCAEGYEVSARGLEELVLEPEDQTEADRLLQSIGLMAQQCGEYDAPFPQEDQELTSSDCSFGCPVKWYWCIYNGGACAGGDDNSCCKLGACGSKHHCEDVCASSDGCHVPPMPSDGGGGGGDEE
jgi:hypothetical protein